MKSICTFLITSLICCSQFLHAADGNNGKIAWLTSYEQAVNEAKSSSKFIVLFFTGSDWCGWCNKLEDEVLDTQEFADSVGNKFIFVKLDFPLYKSIDPQLAGQNKQLQRKYDVKGYPTLIILDSNQQQIGVTGYRAGGPSQYANHLLDMIKNYTAYKQKMQNIDQRQYTGADLKQLYEKANELGLDNDANTIMKIGTASDEKPFFLLEQYRYLVSDGQIHGSQAKELKAQLLASDPNNEQKIPYQIAVIDFESYCEEMEKDHYSPELAVAPLIAYIEKYGSQDKQNLWRLNMIISQVYLDNKKISEALKYAQASYSTAPSSVQPEIATAIKNMQKK